MVEEYIFRDQTYAHDEIKPTFLGNIADHSGLMPIGATILHRALQLTTLGRLNLRKLAINSAVEGIEYRRATGKNPNLHPLETIAFTAAEVAITSIDYGAFLGSAIATLGIDLPIAIPGAIAADIAIGTLMAKGIERLKFPPKDIDGRRVQVKAAEHAAMFAGLLPVLPVAPTVSFIQWYGRHEVRHHAKKVGTGRR